jgi:hypothetical protein
LVVLRRAFLSVSLAFAATPALGRTPPDKLAFYFRAEPRTTIAYRVTEGESWPGGTEARPSLRWHHTVTLALGEPNAETWPATLTISDVRVESGQPSLFVTLARIAEGSPIPVQLDRRGGFVQEVASWPSVKAELKRALAARASRDEALLVPEILDRLDAEKGAGAVGRVLALISGGYAMSFRPDGSPFTMKDWQGGSAYILPGGRTLTSRLAGHDRAKGLAAVDWSIATDPVAAARHLGPELRSIFASGSGPDFARARSELDKALASGVIALEESGQVVYEMRRRIITRYGSKLVIGVGSFRKERGIFAEARSP